MDREPLTVDENVDPITGELLDPKLDTKSREFSSILYQFQGITLEAKKIVTNYTLFRRALLPLGDVNKLVVRAWNHSYTGKVQVAFPDKAITYVCERHPCGIRILTWIS